MAEEYFDGKLVTLAGKTLLKGLKRSREESLTHAVVRNLKARVLENGSLRLFYQTSSDDRGDQKFAARMNHWRPIVQLAADRDGLVRECEEEDKEAFDLLIAERNEQIAVAKAVADVPFKWHTTIKENSVVLPPSVPMNLPLWEDPVVWLPMTQWSQETIQVQESQEELDVAHTPDSANRSPFFNVYGTELQLVTTNKSCFLRSVEYRGKHWEISKWNDRTQMPPAVAVDHKIYFFLDAHGTPSCFDLMFPERLVAMRSLEHLASAFVSDQIRYIYALNHNFVYCFDTIMNRWDCLFQEYQIHVGGPPKSAKVIGDWIFVKDNVDVFKAHTTQKAHGWYTCHLDKVLQWADLPNVSDAAWHCLCLNAECTRVHKERSN